jgi:hypothetical protein
MYIYALYRRLRINNSPRDKISKLSALGPAIFIMAFIHRLILLLQCRGRELSMGMSGVFVGYYLVFVVVVNWSVYHFLDLGLVLGRLFFHRDGLGPGSRSALKVLHVNFRRQG